MVVPYAAGGPVDTIGRIMAARLSDLLGQQIIVENIGGAGGMTGAARVAKATPDGYTLLLSGSAVLAINQTLYKRPLYNAVTDFEQVALFSELGARPDRAAEFPRQHARRIHRLRKGQPVQDAVRLGRRRVRHSCLRRPARCRDGHQDHARAVSRRRPRDAGPDRRPDRLHRRTDFDRAATDPRKVPSRRSRPWASTGRRASRTSRPRKNWA